MIQVHDKVKRKSDGTEMIVTSIYYGDDRVPTHFICKWHEDGELHMATLSADEVA